MRGEETNVVQGQQEKSQHCNEPISVENMLTWWWIFCLIVLFFPSLRSHMASLPQTAYLSWNGLVALIYE